jgi:hypothetical protein
MDNTGDGSKKFFNYRLMTYEEIPSWFVEHVVIFYNLAKIRCITPEVVWAW